MISNSKVALALPNGARLGRYEIAETIGQGTFGVTYKSFSHRFQSACVLKELLPVDFATRATNSYQIVPLIEENQAIMAKCRADFRREAAILHEVNHPNVVRILDFFDENGTSYMVMPFEAGCDYEHFLKQRESTGRVLSEDELLRFLFPVMEGLASVHAKGFLHRDIKPENILVTEKGSPLLIDFGAARQVIGSRSRPISMILTPKYAPFEQYSTTQRQGPYTDIYSLAAVIHRALTGGPPLEAPDRAAGEDPYIPLVKRCCGLCSPEFLAAVDWALQPKKEARPQSIEAWRAAFPRLNDPRPAKRTQSVPALPETSLPVPPPLPFDSGTRSVPPPPPTPSGSVRPQAAPHPPAPPVATPHPPAAPQAPFNKKLPLVAAGVFVLCFLLIFSILRLAN